MDGFNQTARFPPYADGNRTLLERFAVLGRLKLIYVMAILVAVPLTAAVYFAAILIQAERDKVSNLDHDRQMIKLVVQISAVVHEQQKERGLSAGFLSTEAAQFGAELAAQRALSDEKRTELLDRLSATEASLLADGHADMIQVLREEAEGTVALRASVDAMDLESAQSIAAYSQRNDQLISIVEELARDANDPFMANSILSFAMFLEIKEATGIERAVGTGAFALGKFTPETMDHFKELLTAQRVLTDVFLHSAGPDQTAFFKTIMQRDEAKAVMAMRDYAVENGLFGDLGDVTPEKWFTQMTKFINGYKELEDFIASKLVDHSESVILESTAVLRYELMLVGVVVGLALLMSVFGTLWTVRNFKRVIARTQMLADGDLETAIPPATSNEFGRLAAALRVFRDNEKQRKSDAATARDARLAEEQQRSRRAGEMDRLQTSIANAVSRGAAGDFTCTVECDFEDEDLKAVARSLNDLLKATGNSIAALSSMLRSLAGSDISVRMAGEYKGSFGELQADANSLASQLAQTFDQIKETVGDSLNEASNMRSNAAQLSERSTDQAASLEEVAATMEELSATVGANADVLAQVEKLASEVRDSSSGGFAAATDTIDAVNRIKGSSDKISEIIDVIESIAFQTNLLALNAAVEAARAGDAGKGFAVVASEVRALAQRSSESAQDISNLIQESASNVENGVVMVQKTSGSLEEITTAIGELSERIDDVVAAGKQQAIGMNEINDAISNLDGITQQNASMADNSSRSASSLSSKIEALSNTISSFKTRDSGSLSDIEDGAEVSAA